MQSLRPIGQLRASEELHDATRIAPARGIAVAMALGGLGWAAILGLVMLVRALLST